MKIERKFYAGVLVIMLILITFGSMLAVDRTITDTDDNISTFITNSNGGVWEATGANLQLAIYDLNSTNGGKATIPTGTISISSTVLLPDNVWIDGQGNESKLILADGVDDDIIRNYDGTNGNTGITISNLHLNGNADGQTVFAIGKTVIELRYCSGCVIDSCYITNSTCQGIWLRGGMKNTIVNTICYRAGANNDSGLITNGAGSAHVCGIWIGGEYASSIVNCKSHDNWAHGFAIEQNYGDRIVKDCLIDGCTAWDNEGGIWVEEGINIIVSNNICYNNTRTGIYSSDYGGIIVGGNTENVLVIGNNCHGNRDRGIIVTGAQNDNISIKCNTIHNHTSHGISVGGVAYNCTISENTICDNDRGIYFSGGKSPRITDNVLMHNSEGIYVSRDVCAQSNADISRNTIIDVYGAGCYGIRTNIDDSVIKDNVIKRTSGNAIRIENAVRQVIEGNQIETTITNPRDGILVYSTGSGCHNSTIRFNRISDCTRDGIRLTSCVDNVVSDNTFYNNDGANIYDNGCTDLTIFDNTNYNLDSRKTMIWNSEGKYYEATGDNIQLAINDLTSGGEVLLPAGVIYTSGDIELINDTRLIGQGMGVTIIKASSGNTDSWVVKARRTGGVGPFDNITVSDLTIDGNGTSGNCLYFCGVTDFLIENVEVLNPATNGIGIWANSARGIITGCKAEGSSTSLSYESFAINSLHDSIIDNCIAYGSAGWGMDFHTCWNCTMSNLLVKDCGYGIKWFGDPGESGGNNTVSNLNLHNINYADGSGIWIKREHNSCFSNINIYLTNGCNHGIYIDGSSGIFLDNVYIENPDEIGFSITDDIADCTDIHINGMEILCTAISTRGIHLDDFDNTTITGLRVDNSPSYNKIENAESFIISDSFIRNGGDMGLSIDASSYFTIRDTWITGNSGDGIDTTISPCNNYKILDCWIMDNVKGVETGLDHNVTIRGNSIKDNSDDGLEIDSQNFTFVDHNTLWGNGGQQLDDNTAGSVKLIEKNIGVDIV